MRLLLDTHALLWWFVGSRRLPAAVRQEGFSALDLSLADAERAGRLDDHVRDPFDRLLIAQSLAGDFTIVSNEHALDRYGVTRLW